jgi:hypothetical protein
MNSILSASLSLSFMLTVNTAKADKYQCPWDLVQVGVSNGLGIEIEMLKGELTVKAPVDKGTPAFKVGLKPADRIVRIEGESTINIDLKDAISKLRGRRGDPVSIMVIRKGWPVPRQFTIIREDMLPLGEGWWANSNRTEKIDFSSLGNGGVRLKGKIYRKKVLANPTAEQHRKEAQKLYRELSMCFPEWRTRSQLKKVSRYIDDVGSLWRTRLLKGGPNSCGRNMDSIRGAPLKFIKLAPKLVASCEDFIEEKTRQKMFAERDWSALQSFDWDGEAQRKNHEHSKRFMAEVAMLKKELSLRQVNAASFLYEHLGWPQNGDWMWSEGYRLALIEIVKWIPQEAERLVGRTEHVKQQCQRADQSFNTNAKRVNWKKCVDRIQKDEALRSHLVLDKKSGMPQLQARVKRCTDQAGLTKIQAGLIDLHVHRSSQPKLVEFFNHYYDDDGLNNSWGLTGQNLCACGDSDWTYEYDFEKGHDDIALYPCSPYAGGVRPKGMIAVP